MILISELKFITNLYQYEQLIKEPTRITKDTSTLIDSFYTRNSNLIISSGMTAMTTSDYSIGIPILLTGDIVIQYAKSMKREHSKHNEPYQKI